MGATSIEEQSLKSPSVANQLLHTFDGMKERASCARKDAESLSIVWAAGGAAHRQ